MDLRGSEDAKLKSIGIRVTPKEVYYAIVEESGDDLELLTAGSVIVPPALELPDQLSFIRTTMLDIMDEYGVRRAGIRLTEYTARRTSKERLNLEGVVQELLSSSAVEQYFAGTIATIAAWLGESDRSRVKGFFEGMEFMEMDSWTDYSRERRESIVTAVAALQIHDLHV